jgi:hypothetical protein
MKALDSLVKTIWIVMAVLVAIGFLVADRYRLTEELAELRQREMALQAQLAQQAEQCRTTQAQLEQALAGEQAQRAEAESQVAALQQQLAAGQQALDGERTQRALAEGQVAALRRELTANRQALAACPSSDPGTSAADSSRPEARTGETATASWPEFPEPAGIVALGLLAAVLAGSAWLVIWRPERGAAVRRNRRPAAAVQPTVRPLYLRRNNRRSSRKRA